MLMQSMAQFRGCVARPLLCFNFLAADDSNNLLDSFEDYSQPVVVGHHRLLTTLQRTLPFH